MKQLRDAAGRRIHRSSLAGALIALTVAASATAQAAPAPAQAAQQELKFYELRTYYAAPGKFNELLAEFRSWIVPSLTKVGAKQIAYWAKEGEGDGAVIYLLAFPDRAERDAVWARFRSDPEVSRSRSAHLARVAAGDGIKPVAKVENVFMTMTDFSPSPRTADGLPLR